jgi:hypothetical protein
MPAALKGAVEKNRNRETTCTSNFEPKTFTVNLKYDCGDNEDSITWCLLSVGRPKHRPNNRFAFKDGFNVFSSGNQCRNQHSKQQKLEKVSQFSVNNHRE